MMEPQKLTVGLFKKKDDNQIEDYEALNINGIGVWDEMSYNGFGEGLSEMVGLKLTQMMENPEQYFNFGFTYCDFKAYMMKITYCRAIRKFIERKRLEKIAEFQANNTFNFNLDQEYQPEM